MHIAHVSILYIAQLHEYQYNTKYNTYSLKSCVVVYLWRDVFPSIAENTDQCRDFKLLYNKVFRSSDRKKTEHGHTVALIQCLLF